MLCKVPLVHHPCFHHQSLEDRTLTQARSIALRFFNGGGSGNAVACASDPSVTEITVGSGLLQVSPIPPPLTLLLPTCSPHPSLFPPLLLLRAQAQSHIFDNFAACQSVPALCFGLRVTRACDAVTRCCQSGGFIASGTVSCFLISTLSSFFSGQFITNSRF
jgi:hypothetical protein